MKTLKQLCKWNRIANIVIAVTLITLVINCLLVAIYEKPINLTLALLQLLIVVTVAVVKFTMYKSRYKLICKELVNVVRIEMNENNCEHFSISSNIAEKKQYFIVYLMLVGKFDPTIYSRISMVANEYLQSAETIVGKTFILNMSANSSM